MADELTNIYGPYLARRIAGEPIGSWTIEELLGSGGYGAVARVRGPAGEPGALKLTDLNTCGDETFILRSYGGDTIPRLLQDATELPDAPGVSAYYVMELADDTLAKRLTGAPIVPCSAANDAHYRAVDAHIPYGVRERYALEVAGALLRALRAADSHVHGDLCPSNVLIFDSGTGFTTKLADWGSAREYQPGLTSHTPMAGKLLWRPPAFAALANGLPVDDPEKPRPPLDIYALGAIVCWILTGTVPTQLTRWDYRDDPDSGAGLPLDRVDDTWHDFLIGTTRADPAQRLSHGAALASLRTIRSAIRPGTHTTETRTRPAPEPPHRSPALVLTAALGAVLIILSTLLIVDTLRSDAPTNPAQPSPSTTTSSCSGNAVVCDRSVLSKIPMAGEPPKLQPSVAGWYRGQFTRHEWQTDTFVPYKYDDAVVARLNFTNSASWEIPIAPDELGLVVALPADTAIPDYGARIAVPGDTVFAWIPTQPPVTDLRTRGKLLPEWAVPKGSSTDNGYPFTALFNLSKISNAEVIGLATGVAHHSGTGPGEATVSTLQQALTWPTPNSSPTVLYWMDIRLAQAVNAGECYVQLEDVGLGDGILDCRRPHFGEVLGTVDAPRSNPDEDVLEHMDNACWARYGADLGVDPALKFYPRGWPVGNSDTEYACLIEAADAANLWVGPQTKAAGR